MLKLLQTVWLLIMVVYCNSKNCCYPDQYETTIDLLMGSVDDKGKTGMITGYLDLSFDAPGKRINIDEVVETSNVTSIKITTLQLYKEGIQYTVVNNSTCSQSKLPEWKYVNCIPDSATMLNQYELGMNSGIEVRDYKWMVGAVSYKMTVTSDSCAPVYEQVVGNTQGVNVMFAYKFENVTPGIKDPHVFDVPGICKEARVLENKMPRRDLFLF